MPLVRCCNARIVRAFGIELNASCVRSNVIVGQHRQGLSVIPSGSFVATSPLTGETPLKGCCRSSPFRGYLPATQPITFETHVKMLSRHKRCILLFSLLSYFRFRKMCQALLTNSVRSERRFKSLTYRAFVILSHSGIERFLN